MVRLIYLLVCSVAPEKHKVIQIQTLNKVVLILIRMRSTVSNCFVKILF